MFTGVQTLVTLLTSYGSGPPNSSARTASGGDTNRGDPFGFPIKKSDGTYELVDRSEEIVQFCKEESVDCLVSIGMAADSAAS